MYAFIISWLGASCALSCKPNSIQLVTQLRRKLCCIPIGSILLRRRCIMKERPNILATYLLCLVSTCFGSSGFYRSNRIFPARSSFGFIRLADAVRFHWRRFRNISFRFLGSVLFLHKLIFYLGGDSAYSTFWLGQNLFW
jgi:hypothetical protein